MNSNDDSGDQLRRDQDINSFVFDPTGSSIDRLPAQTVPLGSLHRGESPRAHGPDNAHVDVLAQAEGRLPPILVHRPTMRIIDGAHRVEAAKLRGEQEIEVSFFDGDENAAFVLAVRANITHGLPLTLADRHAAAARILASYPDRSDRAIAQVSGLSNATVGTIRRRTTVDSGQSNARRGKDGRLRPLNAAEGRRRAARMIAENPDASLRRIAQEAGISVGTARDVRQRLANGQAPVLPRQREAEENTRPASKPVARDSGSPENSRSHRAPEMILELLRRDPSIRSSEVGRALLKWLTTQAVVADRWEESIDSLPPHSNGMMLELARGFAQEWTRFADELEHRVKPNSYR
jgi:ParB-like chromosome segregation protein Spo0J